MNKDKCEHYDYCCSHELCEKCVAVQIIYGRNEYVAVGIEEHDIEIDDSEILPF